MTKFVIRNKNGMYFTSTERETYGEEITYNSKEQAEKVLRVIRAAIRDEEFDIIEIDKQSSKIN